MLKRTILGAVAAIGLLGAADAGAQTLNIGRIIDAERYDPHRTTARSAFETGFMLFDTLVALDYDMKTIKPLLAKSWTVSPDGKVYTFKLREDVTFCSGKKFTADDVVYSVKRLIDPATRAPIAWRNGKVKEIKALDPYTVHYELEAPFSELLINLAQLQGSIINKDDVEKLGADFGVKGADGTGPYCWESWVPRNEFVLKRHAAYKWGADIEKNAGPANFEKVIWKIIPEETTRLASLKSGQTDITQYVPYSEIDDLKKDRNLVIVEPKNYFWTYFVGFKVDKPEVADPVVRKAMAMAVDNKALVDAVWYGHAVPADSFLHPDVPDFNPATRKMAPSYDPKAANKLLDEAGYKKGPDGIRVKNGVKIEPTMYALSSPTARQIAEALQGFFREIGVGLNIQLWDATVGWNKLATQEFGMFQMSFPYVSAGDAVSLYFHSKNKPTPNRMNWTDETTDAAIDAGRGALDEKARMASFGKVQEQVQQGVAWIPIAHEKLFLAANKKLEGVKAHGIYGCAIYKGMDLKFKS